MSGAQGSGPPPGTSTGELAAARGAVDELRASWAAILDLVGSGRMTVAEVFGRAAVEPEIGSLHVLSVLEAVPGARKVDSRRLLDGQGIPPAARVVDLDPEVRQELAARAATSTAPRAPTPPTGRP